MSGKVPEGFSLSFGAGSSPNESVSDLFLRTAISPTFPFLHVKLIPDDDSQNGVVEVKVSKQIYDFLKVTSQTDDVLFYLSNTTGQLIPWAYDLVTSMKILFKLEIFENIDTWINNARSSLNHLMKNEKIEPSFESKNALQNSKELLQSLEIFDQVEKTDLIFSAVNEALKEKTMDADTLIYRLAMAIFHSNRGTDRSIISAIDDPSSIYLKLIKSTSYNKWQSEFSDMINLPLESRIKVMKVLTVFTISSYAYYKTMKGGS